MAWVKDAASLGISFGMSMGHTSNASSMQLYDNDMEYVFHELVEVEIPGNWLVVILNLLVSSRYSSRSVSLECP